MVAHTSATLGVLPHRMILLLLFFYFLARPRYSLSSEFSSETVALKVSVDSLMKGPL
jgi:hypothetical protein